MDEKHDNRLREQEIASVEYPVEVAADVRHVKVLRIGDGLTSHPLTALVTLDEVSNTPVEITQ
jgi:hypothetical protein